MDETTQAGFKDFEAVYKKGKFHPKDRVLMLIANVTAPDMDRKRFLTEDQVREVREGWEPRNKNEEEEYSRWSSAWRSFCIAEIDAEATFLNTALEVKELIWRGLFVHASMNYIRASDIVQEIESNQKLLAPAQPDTKEQHYLDLIRGLHAEMSKMIKTQLDLELTAEPAGIQDAAEGMKDLLSKDAFARKRKRLLGQCAKLLAFEDFYARSSKAFEQDLATKFRKWKFLCFQKNLSTFNAIADEAFNDKGLRIDPATIAPARESIEGFYATMNAILGGGFSQ